MSTCKFCGVPESRHGTCCGEANAIQFAPATQGGVEIVTGDPAQDAFLRVTQLERENAKLREALRLAIHVRGTREDTTDVLVAMETALANVADEPRART